jgi:hypothetical protein
LSREIAKAAGQGNDCGSKHVALSGNEEEARRTFGRGELGTAGQAPAHDG